MDQGLLTVGLMAQRSGLTVKALRHYDRVGVLAAVLGLIKNHGINVEEMSNTIFQGGKAAVAALRVASAPPAELVRDIAGLEGQVIAVEVKG